MTVPPIRLSRGTTNYHPNPTFDDGISGYSVGSLGMNPTHHPTGGVGGSGCLQFQSDGSAATAIAFLRTDLDVIPTNPSPWVGSVAALFPAGVLVRASLSFTYADASSEEAGRVDYTATGAFERIERTATPNPAKTISRVMMRFQVSTGSNPMDIRFDNVQIEQGSTATPFVVGTRPGRALPGSMKIGTNQRIGPLRVGERN